MKNAALLVLLSVVVAGCMTDAEREARRCQQLESLSHQGQRKLDSLLGVKIGEVFPGDSDVDKTSLTNFAPHEIKFETKRKFMDAPWFRNEVALTSDGRVYRLSSTAFPQTPRQLDDEIKRRRNSNSYSISASSYQIGGGSYVSGTVTPSSGYGGLDMFTRSEKKFQNVAKMLQEKYGKNAVLEEGNMVYSSLVIPFEDGRKITLERKGDLITLKAVDERLEAEAKNQEAAEKAKTTGINAL